MQTGSRKMYPLRREDMPKDLKDVENYNLTIKCRNRSWELHKEVVCARSEFFMRACTGHFKEAEESVIELHEEDPNLIDKMLTYFYTCGYDDSDLSEPCFFSQVLNVRMYVLGDRFFIQDLKDYAVQQFISHSENEWEYAIPDLLEAIYTELPDNDRPLRTLISSACAKSKGGYDRKKYDRLMEELPDAHIEILQKTLAIKVAALADMDKRLDCELADKQRVYSANRQLESYISLLQSDVAKHESTTQKLQQKITCLENQRDYLTSRVRGFEADTTRSRLKIEKAELKAENGRLSMEVDTLKVENRRLLENGIKESVHSYTNREALDNLVEVINSDYSCEHCFRRHRVMVDGSSYPPRLCCRGCERPIKKKGQF